MILLHKIRLTNSTEASVSRSAKEKKSNAETFIILPPTVTDNSLCHCLTSASSSSLDMRNSI